MKKFISICVLIVLMCNTNALFSQSHSIARTWNEALLTSIRKDLARPTIHARNLFHTSVVMFDAWAVMDSVARPYFLGNTFNGFNVPFTGFTPATTIEAERAKAISYAMYRLLLHRFRFSPEGLATLKTRLDLIMVNLGYSTTITSTNYSTGDGAALGNYLADRMIAFGLQDGSREGQNYTNSYYTAINPGLNIFGTGNPTVVEPNRWQPLTLTTFIDQNGNVIPGNTPPFLSAQWGDVIPFSLTNADKKILSRNGRDWNVYCDPGPPVALDTTSIENSEHFKRNHGMVIQWSSHLTPDDGVLLDISPGNIGNSGPLPQTPDEQASFYIYTNGGNQASGYSVNPFTSQPYAPNIVKRGDYTRVLAEFWADGPSSETPPGHWFALLNYVSDSPELVKKYRGIGRTFDALEWDVKSYFALGGAMHDAAVSTWSIKGYYDSARPITAIRYMAMKGQSTDPNLPHYHPAGLELIPGFVELISAGDPLVGASNQNLNKIKIKAWKAHSFISNPATTYAGVDWILAEQWWPYQRQTFVTPPFAAYVSGHSTYSSAAATLLSDFTGDEYFPGGLGTFTAKKNEYLVFEEGPSEDVILQWATYRDAADQSGLSRIWGGIHSPMDDAPGRINGLKIGAMALSKAETYFAKDDDGDGFTTIYDCNDDNPNVNPDAVDVLCDDLDNDCDGIIDGSVDYDGDLIGDSCDTDKDGDGVDNKDDICPLTKVGAMVTVDGCTDADGDGYYPDIDSSDVVFDANDSNKCFPDNTQTYCDIDGDGLTNEQELLGMDGIPSTGDETDPKNPDSDGDGISDYQELQGYSDPNDPCSPLNTSSDCAAEISGYAFNDSNYDGIYTNADQALESIEVKLYRTSDGKYFKGVLAATTYTDVNGFYRFAGIVDTGLYFVHFGLPRDYSYTRIDVSNDALDSDVKKKDLGNTLLIHIAGANEIFANVYAGYYECTYVGDVAWYDENKNDVADKNENGINGLLVDIYRFENGVYSYMATRATGHKPNTPSDDGYYSFCVPPGQYYLKFNTPPQGIVPARQNIGTNEAIDSDITRFFGPGTTDAFSVTLGNDRDEIDAGFYPMATVGNLVWLDLNVNGLQDLGEPGLANIQVEAYDINDILINSAKTDADGHYFIDYLGKEQYYLKFNPQSSYISTLHLNESDQKNSDIDHSNGYLSTRLIALEPGEVNPNIDAGFSFGALPLLWIKADGIKIGQSNRIYWITAQEVNCDRFEIEWSTDGLSFITLGSVKAKNLIKNNHYNFEDQRKSTQNTDLYRIKQIDYDGTFSYSQIISIGNDNNSNIAIFPNPARDLLNVVGDELKEGGTYVIYNSTGSLVQRGSLTPQIDISKLVTGVFSLHTYTNDKKEILYFIKSN